MAEKNQLNDEVAARIDAQRRTSRRQFLGRGALVAGGLVFAPTLLAACSNDDETSTGTTGGGTGTSGDNLRISNWPLYISPGFNEAFTEATGISVNYQENFQDNESWFAANKDALNAGQDIGADLFVPTDFLAARLISLGWLAELDKDNIPNLSNLRPDLVDLPADPGQTYVVPYMAGIVGLAYNKAETGRDITSVDDLWDPAFKGRVSLFSDMRDALGMIMLAQGNDPANPTEEAVQQAADLVASENAKGQIRKFTGNDYQDDLTSGNIIVAQVYSGDVAQLQEDNPNLEFVVPSDGAVQFVDTLAIPSTTRNQQGAEEWINFVYDRANYAELIAEIQYIPVLSDMTEALTELDPELADNPLVNPPQATLDLLTSWASLTDEQDQEFASIYAAVTGG